MIQQINSQSGNTLQATISGQGLVVTDTTVTSANGGNTFSISNATGSTAASDLGIVGSSKTNTVGGSPILGGLQTVLLSDLNGGQGVGALGYMKLTDGNGHSVNVDLSSATTLQGVIDDINNAVQANNAGKDAQTVGITAEVNSAGDGIQLVDTFRRYRCFDGR